MAQLTQTRKLNLEQSAQQLLIIWLVLRVLTSVWAAMVSPLYPFTPIEQEVALWPPSTPAVAWLERAMVAPWDRRDSMIFKGIVADGYQADPASMAFHPLYPWLATPLSWVVGHPLLALLLVSSVAGLAYLILFERLARFDFEPDVARTSALLMLLFPPAYALFAAYAEALFLLLAVLCFIWMRQRRWWLAGLAGGLATLTRQQGIFLLLPLAWELWEAVERNPRRAVAGWRDWLSLGLIPLGYLVWVLYRAFALNDVQPDFSSAHTLIYSLFISPNAEKIIETQTFLWPWHALWLAIETFMRTGQFRILLELGVGGVFLALTALAWPRLRLSYRFYVVAIIAISFAYHTGGSLPYSGLPRHLLLAFPVFIGLGPYLKRKWRQLVFVLVELVGFLFLLMLFVARGYVP